MRVTVYDGKYTVIQDAGGGLRAERYGEYSCDCTGDGLILALAQEVEALRAAPAETCGLHLDVGTPRADIGGT